MKRQRGRNRNHNNNKNNNNPNRSMDSNGPDVKVRGNASTIYEKYVQLARDATSNGSRVKAENLLQHAEHYLRLVNAQEAEKKAREEEREAQQAARRAQNGGQEKDENSEGDEGQNRRPRRGDRRPRSNDNNNSSDKAADTHDEAAALADADPTPKPRARKAVKTDETPAGLESVEPTAQDSLEAAPKRRRAAPKRKEKPTDTVDAAE